MDQADELPRAITKYPQPVLRRPSDEVRQFDEQLRALAERMFQIMYAAGGVGLAAPQVGRNVRLFVANPTGTPGEGERVYVNPEIVAGSGAQASDEGCLSVPGASGRIERHARVTIRAQDLTGQAFEETAEGLLARIFQHETDHLAGVLIVDRMSAVARLSNRRVLKELEDKHAGGDSDGRTPAGAA